MSIFSIAIDGPAGAGKSTIARRIAKEMGCYYVDTGAIYRTVAYFLDLLGVSPKDVDGVERYIDELTIEITYDEEGKQHMLMNGMDVTDDIRTQDISQKASLVSAHAIVREALLDMQRDVARNYDVIMDGRDIGTVVLPDAQVKIFLTAEVEERVVVVDIGRLRRQINGEALGDGAKVEHDARVLLGDASFGQGNAAHAHQCLQAIDDGGAHLYAALEAKSPCVHQRRYGGVKCAVALCIHLLSGAKHLREERVGLYGLIVVDMGVLL